MHRVNVFHALGDRRVSPSHGGIAALSLPHNPRVSFDPLSAVSPCFSLAGDPLVSFDMPRNVSSD